MLMFPVIGHRKPWETKHHAGMKTKQSARTCAYIESYSNSTRKIMYMLKKNSKKRNASIRSRHNTSYATGAPHP